MTNRSFPSYAPDCATVDAATPDMTANSLRPTVIEVASWVSDGTGRSSPPARIMNARGTPLPGITGTRSRISESLANALAVISTPGAAMLRPRVGGGVAAGSVATENVVDPASAPGGTVITKPARGEPDVFTTRVPPAAPIICVVTVVAASRTVAATRAAGAAPFETAASIRTANSPPTRGATHRGSVASPFPPVTTTLLSSSPWPISGSSLRVAPRSRRLRSLLTRITGASGTDSPGPTLWLLPLTTSIEPTGRLLALSGAATSLSPQATAPAANTTKQTDTSQRMAHAPVLAVVLHGQNPQARASR